MKLCNSISEYVAAAFSGIYVVSHEHDDAVNELMGLCAKHKWPIATWDISRGLYVNGQPTGDDEPNPVAAIKAIKTLASPDPEAATLLVLRNFHKFLDSPEIIQTLEIAIMEGKQNRTFVLILAPTVALPIELQKLFVVVDHELPDRAEMETVLRTVATQPEDLPDAVGIGRILDAAAGLTRMEAESAFALSLVRHPQVKPETIWQIKSAAMKKSGLLNLHEGTEKFDCLGGLENLKGFCKRALMGKRKVKKAKPKGVMLLGVPGGGKSAFAKALGNEVERPTISLNIGSLMGSLVGETERNTRQALSIIDAMAPAIVYVDEIEKALGGAASGNGGDSGVGQRMFGTLLTWLNDHTTDVFFIATSNDISKLPPEFSRAGRFDAIFFVDLPTNEQQRIIWDMYIKAYELDKQKIPSAVEWTGAEIESCCRLAAMLDITLMEASQNIVPIAVTSGESVERLRDWASGRCLSAERPGLYSKEMATPIKPGRNIKRGTSNN